MALSARAKQIRDIETDIHVERTSLRSRLHDALPDRDAHAKYGKKQHRARHVSFTFRRKFFGLCQSFEALTGIFGIGILDVVPSPGRPWCADCPARTRHAVDRSCGGYLCIGVGAACGRHSNAQEEKPVSDNRPRLHTADFLSKALTGSHKEKK